MAIEHYSPFEPVSSGAKPGTTRGALPDLEDGASAFRYRKQIFVTVFGSSPDSIVGKVSGNWKVRIRADDGRGDDDAYSGEILFEQEVRWVANLILVGDFVTWSPGGPAGGGDQKTTICDGEPCAGIDNIFAPKEGELEAYGETGAWRYVEGQRQGNSTPGQKFDFERGFVAPDSFVPEGNFFAGGATFTCEWQSANYQFDLPEGAILETVFDRWQVGTLDTEAFYKFSSKPGDAAPFVAFVHSSNRLFAARAVDGDVHIEMMKERLTDIKKVGEIKGVTALCMGQADRREKFVLLGRDKERKGAFVYWSRDEGGSWKIMAKAFDSTFKTQGGALLYAGMIGAVALKDDAIWFAISFDEGLNWKESVKVADKPKGLKSLALLFEGAAGKSKLIVTDFVTCRFDSAGLGAEESWRPV